MSPTRSARCPDWFLAVLALLLVLVPAPAHAHAALSESEIQTVLHPLIVPSHLLVLIGLCLWIGQHEAKLLRVFLYVYPLLTAVALGLTLAGVVTEVYQPILLGIALTLGTLVGLEKSLPPAAGGALFAGAALAIGFDSGVEGAATPTVLKALFGIWISQLVVVLSVSHYFSFCLKRNWTRVGLRVLGSWIIAIALLALAFSLKR